MPNYNGINYTASTDGPYFSSGEIKWSTIRSTFNPSGSSQNIKSSDYVRYINTDLKDPLLPDCTENNAVPSSQSNWKTSQLRNTIRRYYVIQNTSISNSYLFRDVNEDGSGSTRWNGNVPKNIVKEITMNKNTTSTDTTKFACTLNAAVGNTPVDTNCYNMTVILPSGGRIIGAGGASGARDSAGGDGGPALLISSNGSNNRFINNGTVSGGGGGGAGGKTGTNGTNGNCTASYGTGGCGGAPGCASGYSDSGQSQGGCCQSTCQWCGWGFCNCQPCVKWTQSRTCSWSQPSTFTSAPTTNNSLGAGYGGAGGKGGYANLDVLIISGLPGAPGNTGLCPTCTPASDGRATTLSGGTCGGNGEAGARGGSWGNAGGSTSAAKGGAGGQGIVVTARGWTY
jgi:hypothetical protein